MSKKGTLPVIRGTHPINIQKFYKNYQKKLYNIMIVKTKMQKEDAMNILFNNILKRKIKQCLSKK